VDPRLIVALDTDRREAALTLVETLRPLVRTFKVGLQLFTAHGPDIVREIAATGADIFLDLKFHDIPNTVAGAVYSTAGLPAVSLLTLHGGGGRRMMEAAVAARDGAAAREPGEAPSPRLLGVTVLTSMGYEDLLEVGVPAPPAEQVERLAALARHAGLDGLVCSPLEVGALRALLGPGPLLITPGIRPAGTDAGDQRRVATPAAALAAGASHLVIGRPITAATSPLEAAGRILAGLP
jgi:orotidine-5'-phosphate decarboxylase